MTFEELISQRGVKCHRCGDFIRPKKIFFRESWDGRYHPEYRNICMKCAQDWIENRRIVYEKEFEKFQTWKKKAKKLVLIYDRKDKEVCLSCKNRMKQITGLCHPRKNCRVSL